MKTAVATGALPTTPLPAEPGHWLLGNARAMQAAPHRYPMQLAHGPGREFGKMARFRLLRRSFIACGGIDAVRHVLITQHKNYPRSYHHATTAIIIGPGLLCTEGEDWLVRRRLVLPSFKHESLDGLTALAAGVVDNVLRQWEGQTEVDALQQCQRITIGTIHRALFSCDLSNEESDAFGRATQESLVLMRNRNLAPVALPMWLPTRANRAIVASRELLDNFVGRHIQARLALPADEWPDDILTLLLRASDEETGAVLTPENVRDELKNLFIAGSETTSTTLTWALYQLARCPELAERWHREVDEKLGDATPTAAALQSLEWTAAIVHETLRLYPVLYNMVRTAQQDDVVCGQQVRRGDIMLISIYALHHDPDEWEEPMEFRPERFLPGREWNRQAFMPFAVGKHQCIGNAFAFTEIMVALAAIGRHFRVSLPKGFSAGERAFITLTPDRPIPLQLEARR